MKREIVLLFHHKLEMDAHILCNIRYIVLEGEGLGSRLGNWEMPIVLSNLIGTRAKEMNLAVRVLYKTSTFRSIHR